LVLLGRHGTGKSEAVKQALAVPASAERHEQPGLDSVRQDAPLHTVFSIALPFRSLYCIHLTNQKGYIMPRIALSKLSIEALQAEIQRRVKKSEKKLNKLLRQRAKLDTQIAELEALAGLPAAAPPAKAKPGRKPAASKPTKKAMGKPLGQYVAQVLSEAAKGLNIKKIEQAVRKAGYPTTAKSIYNPIMKVLRKGGFKRVEAGVYAARNAVAAPVAEVVVPKTPRAKAKSVLPAPATKLTAPKAPNAKRKKRGQFKETADEFVLGLVTGKGKTTSEVGKAWKEAGRGGKADTTLGNLVAAHKIKREKIKGEKGSIYTLA
jgi:hypothetical protein